MSREGSETACRQGAAWLEHMEVVRAGGKGHAAAAQDIWGGGAESWRMMMVMW